MIEPQQSDIEIYVAAPAPRIIAWLQQRFSWAAPLAPSRRGGMSTHRGRLLTQPGRVDAGNPVAEPEASVEVPVLVVADIADGYTSVLFDSPAAPWPDDLACAKEMATALDCEIRCTNGSWQPDQAEDEGWLSVTRTGARAIRWKPA